MKKLTTLLFGTAAMLLAFTTVSCTPESEKLSGTYTFDRVYDLVVLMKDGSKVSAREMGAINNTMNLFGNSLLEETGMTDISFTFSGSNCTMSVQGQGSMSGSYTLSGNRLVINIKGLDGGKLDMGYRSSPQPIFIWDFKTFESVGLDPVEEIGDDNLQNLEMWIAMNYK